MKPSWPCKWAWGAGALLVACGSTERATDDGMASVRASEEGATEERSYRGVARVGDLLSFRLLNEPSGIDLPSYLADPSLTLFLGVQRGDGISDRFANGVPNGINVLLWYVVLQAFARDLAANCSGESEALDPVPLRPELEEVVNVLCTWPSAEAQAESVMFAFWSGLVDYDAPRSEFGAWRRFFTTSYLGAQPADAVADMTVAALYSPYFLLEQ